MITVFNTVDEMHNRKISAVITAIIALVTFVILYSIHIFIADTDKPNPPILKTELTVEPTEEILQEIKLDASSGGSSGGGTASNDPVSEPRPQTENTLYSNSASSVNVNKGNSKHNSSDNSQNPTTTTEYDPFKNGTGGSGGGEGTGKGGKFGNDSGTSGKGPAGSGNGSGKGRVRLNNLNVDAIEVPRDVTIYLVVTIDEDGNVVAVRSTSRTTTTDQQIIGQVKSMVKNQIHFSKDPGSGLVEVYYTVLINAN